MNFLFKIIILVCLILSVSYYNTYMSSYSSNIEPFKSSKQFVLLGDSILNNENYVGNGKSVTELFMERTDNKIICLAEDDSKIMDVYNQLDKIPANTDTYRTTIFLSIGGNDILFHLVEQKNDKTETGVLDELFSKYKKLVEQIKTEFPESQIVVLDIYYPNNATYSKYHQVIQEWNQMLYDYASKNSIRLVKISSYLTQPEDFTHGIEPSAIGGDKLVSALLSGY